MKLLVVGAILLLALSYGQLTEADPECRKECTTEYKPVCCVYEHGHNKTFKNECHADYFNCRKNRHPTSVYPGECDSSSSESMSDESY
uniref:Uncharacterized protein n=1 Tax=Phlebotomus papatasi TaxID=29031 RepID=A0A1B0GM71_PHLPP